MSCLDFFVVVVYLFGWSVYWLVLGGVFCLFLFSNALASLGGRDSLNYPNWKFSRKIMGSWTHLCTPSLYASVWFGSSGA